MKKIKLCCVIAIFLFLFTGCSAPTEGEAYGAARQIIRTAEEISSKKVGTESAAAENTGSVVKETGTETGDYEADRERCGLTAENIQTVREAQNGKYAYGYIAEDEQKLYAEILLILQGHGENVMVSGREENVIGKVFQCVLNDHPEIFWVSGYTYTKYTLGEEVRRITFSGTYTMSPMEVSERQKEIDAYTAACLGGISGNMSEYEKVKYVYEYVVKNTEYNLQAQDNQNICSVFLNKESVCQGYAKAMQYLLERLNVYATLVVGTVENGEGHAWNLVRIDGAYYYVDATWGDAYYVLDESDYDYPREKMPNINYDYLCVTTRQMEVTHRIDNVVPMPECVAMNANYYVMEGAYFTDCDMEKLAALFRKGYERGDELVTMKCSDAAVYAQMKRTLLEEKEVFQYLNSTDGMVAYTDNAQQFSISFWL